MHPSLLSYLSAPALQRRRHVRKLDGSLMIWSYIVLSPPAVIFSLLDKQTPCATTDVFVSFPFGSPLRPWQVSACLKNLAGGNVECS